MLNYIFDFDFIKAIQNNGGEVYLVGGCVRDLILNKTPKDVDLIVRNIPMPNLLDILSEFGKYDLVGESFSVIKFKYNDNVYDIALPRIDKKIEGAKGHKSIEAQSDYTLPLKDDLFRRDYTINALAIDKNFDIIDYFDGLYDIKNKIIKCVSENSFIEDPLRMIRGLQFASRFDFTIEPKTYNLIKEHASLIKEITMERIFDELQKPFDDFGNIQMFIELLRNTGIFEYVFGIQLRAKFTQNTRYLSEMLFFGLPNNINKASFYKKLFPSINDKIWKDLKALDIIFDDTEITFHKMFKALQYSHIVLNTLHIPNKFKTPFITGLFPKKIKELALTGDDLINMGFKQGKQIGVMNNNMLEAILDFKIKNNKEELIKYITP